MRRLPSIKEDVRQLRRKGLSLNEIYLKTKVPPTTIRTWIYDIKLSTAQTEVFKKRIQTALQAGRIRAQALQREIRNKKEKDLNKAGQKQIGKLSLRDIFIAGVALYWAEGFKNKHERRLGFCNSDPRMIKFYINWLEKTLNVKKSDLIARLTLNISYKDKAREIENYWSKITGISINKFTKPFYQNSLWKKQFNTDDYKGVLRVHVKDSLDNLLRMKGWLEGLSDL